MDSICHDHSNNAQSNQFQLKKDKDEESSGSSPEEDRLWIVVRENSTDFYAWTSLIQEIEDTTMDNLPKIRRVYDSFLEMFPLCYGYWKKYADHEVQLGSFYMTHEVYERAVQAVTYSVDIWMYFCTFAMATYEDPDDIRRLFERALSYVGRDYQSHPLWNKYIEFECSQQEWSRLGNIYTRVLQIPIHLLDSFYESFKQLATSRTLTGLQAVEESTPSGSPKPEAISSSEAETLDEYLAIREGMYKKAKEVHAKIQDFENTIRRPYFHVKALDKSQLDNWHRYLDFVEKEGDFAWTVKLYEKCLIACANYSEFWIRYIHFMELNGGREIANDALTRATQIFVKRSPDIHIFSARFKEQLGDLYGARAKYHLLSSELAPGLIECIVKNANMEQRQGNSEMASSIFETAIETEKGKGSSQSLFLLFIQYSRFLDLKAVDTDRAREVLVGAVQLFPFSKLLLEALIYFESVHTGSKHIDYLDSLIEEATTPKPNTNQVLNDAEREEISSIFLEFVDLFGDIYAINKAEARHRQLFSRHWSPWKSNEHSYTFQRISKNHDEVKPNNALKVFPPECGLSCGNGLSEREACCIHEGYSQLSQKWQHLQSSWPKNSQKWNFGYCQQKQPPLLLHQQPPQQQAAMLQQQEAAFQQPPLHHVLVSPQCPELPLPQQPPLHRVPVSPQCPKIPLTQQQQSLLQKPQSLKQQPPQIPVPQQKSLVSIQSPSLSLLHPYQEQQPMPRQIPKVPPQEEYGCSRQRHH